MRFSATPTVRTSGLPRTPDGAHVRVNVRRLRMCLRKVRRARGDEVYPVSLVPHSPTTLPIGRTVRSDLSTHQPAEAAYTGEADHYSSSKLSGPTSYTQRHLQPGELTLHWSDWLGARGVLRYSSIYRPDMSQVIDPPCCNNLRLRSSSSRLTIPLT